VHTLIKEGLEEPIKEDREREKRLSFRLTIISLFQIQIDKQNFYTLPRLNKPSNYFSSSD